MCWLVPWAKPGLAFFILLNSRRKTTECRYFYTISYVVKVILCQKHSFLHQIIQNMTTDFSLIYTFNTINLQVQSYCVHCKPIPVMKTGFSLFSISHRENPVLALYWPCTGPVLALYQIAVHISIVYARLYGQCLY